MTTLELANRIIDAVERAGNTSRTIQIERLFRVLEETDSWFCRLSVDLDADGLPGETHESKYEDPRQPGLFK